MGKYIDLTGQKFGRWMVIKRSYPNSKWGQPRYLCKCNCGKEKVVDGRDLKNGKSKSCGCIWRETKRLGYGIAGKNALTNNYKSHAIERGIEFNLTIKQFEKLTQQECYYCGTKPNQIIKYKTGFGEYTYNGVDRINNDLGYTPENSVACCKTCNSAKGILTLQEFEDWIKKIHNNLKQKERSKE